ncbi:MAG: T9SS type A sorting domain-containing protein [Candidatus Goldbacteria bacterium]|nr:T9SS type A sorting domain-containing protein [Candidatus Goldiibacteriota bacterium]
MKKKIKTIYIFFIIFIIPFFIFSATAIPTVTVYDSFATNSNIYAVTRAANVLYIGGSFTRIGKRVGTFYFCDINGNPITSPKMPQVDGAVYTIAPDGAGGFYIGGSFSYVGGLPRTNLAHIYYSGEVNPNWRPTTNGIVRVITIGSNGKIYIGGSFTQVTGTDGVSYNRYYIADLDPLSGNVLGLDLPCNGTVYDINYYSSAYLIIGGSFTTVNNESRPYLALINPSGNSGVGTLYSQNYGINGTVFSIVRPTGSIQTFIGGSFTQVQGTTTRNRIAMYSSFYSTTPTAQDFNLNNTVYSLYFENSNSTLYAVGNFTTVNGGLNTRNYAAAFNTSTAQATSFNPNLNGTGYCITSNGTNIYIGGFFEKVNGSIQRLYAAAFDKSTGSVIASWQPELDNYVYSMAPDMSTSNNIAIGGIFRAAKTVFRNRLASVDILSDTIYSWNPDVNGTVYAIGITETTVVAGGEFTAVNSERISRNYLAAFDRFNGNVTSWYPKPNSYIYSLIFYSGYIYIGGNFTVVDGVTRNHGAAFDLASGSLISWDPNTNREIKCLKERNGIIYAGGNFTTTGGGSYTRNYAAAFSSVAGVTQSWNPNCNDIVNAIEAGPNVIYLGGNFTSVGGVTRNRVACVDLSGNVTSFNPDVNNTVNGLYLNNDVLFILGSFTTVNGGSVSCPRVALYDLVTSRLIDWYPNPNSSLYCATNYANRVFIGGLITQVSYLPHGFGAILECPPQFYTPTATITRTITMTFTRTITFTITNTPTFTSTYTHSPTRTITPSNTPTWTRTSTPTVTFTNVPVYPYPFFDTFQNNLDWDYGTEWERKPAITPFATPGVGYPDPITDVSATSDNYIAGTVIGGNMSTTIHPFYYLTSPYIDASSASELQLRFYRYLNCDYVQYISATVEVYDGSSWIQIYLNPPSQLVTDNEWKEMVYDVTAYKSSKFRVRFGHSVNKSGAFIMSGWNLDDIYIGLPLTPTITNTSTRTFTFTPTYTTTYTFTYTITLTNTSTFTPTNTNTSTFTITNTSTYTITLTITNTYTISPTFTNIIFSPTISPTHSISPTITYTFTNTNTGTYTHTFTSTFTITNTITPSYTNTITNTWTNTRTFTLTFTSTQTITPTFTYTTTERPTNTQTLTSTQSQTETFTHTSSITFTWTITPTFTSTLTNTRTFTLTFTETNSFTITNTNTLTITETPSNTWTYTNTFTPTPTETYSLVGIFGNNSYNSTQISGGSSLYASRFELIQSGTVRKIYVYIESGTGLIMTGIYTDLSGQPDALYYPCPPQECVAGWNVFNIPLIHLNPGYYWLAVQAQSGIRIGYISNMPFGSGVSVNNAFGTFPDPFGDATPLNRLWSIYVEFYPDLGYLVTATVTPTNTITSTNTMFLTPTPTFTVTPIGPPIPKEGQAYTYPLPADSKITFVYSLPEDADVSIFIFDFSGNLIKHEKHTGINSNTNRSEVKTSDLAPGIYYYFIKAKTISGKEIKFKLNKFIIKR